MAIDNQVPEEKIFFDPATESFPEPAYSLYVTNFEIYLGEKDQKRDRLTLCKPSSYTSPREGELSSSTSSPPTHNYNKHQQQVIISQDPGSPSAESSKAADGSSPPAYEPIPVVSINSNTLQNLPRPGASDSTSHEVLPPQPQPPMTLPEVVSSEIRLEDGPRKSTVTPLRLLKDQTDLIDCPFCQQRTETMIKRHASKKT